MLNFFKALIPCIFITLNACRSGEKPIDSSKKIDDDIASIIPVTEFLKGQLLEIDSMPVTPLKTVTLNGKRDSIWLKRETIRAFAAPFLDPVIDSASMFRYFAGKSFLDQTVNAFTFSYDPKIKLPDSLHLTHWDVYVDPQKNTIQRVYLVKEQKVDSADITTQLTWQSNQWCSIRTITQVPGKEPQIKEEKLTWEFNN
ncbi:MAG TPA: hypothetical protein VN726_13325 [Hanamia sp.]|nr:hypothetical protein [Hanamia sp.]